MNDCVQTVVRCKVCGVQKREANHWRTVALVPETHELIIGELTAEAVDLMRSDPLTVAVCGPGDALALVSRWLETGTLEPPATRSEPAERV
jgi:hypothetical protein